MPIFYAAESEFTFFMMRDFFRAAVFFLMMPLLAARSYALIAFFAISLVVSFSFFVKARANVFESSFKFFFAALFLMVRLCVFLSSFAADFVFGIKLVKC